MSCLASYCCSAPCWGEGITICSECGEHTEEVDLEELDTEEENG